MKKEQIVDLSSAGKKQETKQEIYIKEEPKKNINKEKIAKIITIVIVVIVFVALFGWGTYQYLQAEKAAQEGYVMKEELLFREKQVATNSLVAARQLDGVIVAKNDANKYPVAVMIENLSSIRPQSGLSKAGVVYETLAEGGITRFMAVFSGENASDIHPVRSARPYYIEWASEYQALYAHCGGSPEALEMLSAFGLPDLDQMHSSQYFWRGAGEAPHNLYTSTELLDLALRDRGYLDKTSDYTSWKFKDEAALAARPTEEKYIRLDFSSFDYQTEYKYDRATNDYLRFNGGVEHVDALTGNQLRAKNVVVQIVPPSWPLSDKDRIGLDVVGEGKVVIFRDGEIIEGQWNKQDRNGRTLFYDKSGKEIEFSRGQTWVEVIPEDKTVEYN